MKRRYWLVVVGLLFLTASDSRSAENRTSTGAGEALKSESRIFTMDRIYPSMFGPKETDRFALLETAEPEVLWITAIRADIVGADGETPESNEYFCHSVMKRHDRQSLSRLRQLNLTVQNPKLFALVQGLHEIRFPQGFGMPVFSNDRFDNIAMVMNPTEPSTPVQVGVDSRIEFVRESRLEREMKPLFLVPLVVKVPLEAPETDHSNHHHGGDETCLDGDDHSPNSSQAHPSEHASEHPSSDTSSVKSVDRAGATDRSPVTLTASGEEQTGHWYVPPGRHTYRYRLGRLDSRIHFDTRAHFIASHLHPFGESLELIDLTTGESVFKATAHNFPNRVAVEKISHYSSREGLKINRSHEHEIVAVYNNTTDQDIDSMAVMYLYLHDSYMSDRAKRGG